MSFFKTSSASPMTRSSHTITITSAGPMPASARVKGARIPRKGPLLCSVLLHVVLPPDRLGYRFFRHSSPALPERKRGIHPPSPGRSRIDPRKAAPSGSRSGNQDDEGGFHG
ncbi:hypothetical protein TNCV_2426301 [Trichonephila clavipes]|nr:hypothetical protein TNCV_2426301 [Trichonephila clavipes]